MAEFGDALGLEVFAPHLSPEVVLEVDAYWAYTSGADVAALLTRLAYRVVALHSRTATARWTSSSSSRGCRFRAGLDFVDATTISSTPWSTRRQCGDRFTALADSYAFLTAGTRPLTARWTSVRTGRSASSAPG